TTYSAELELVTGEGKRRSPVAVGCVENDLGDLIDTEFHIHVVALLDLDVTFFFEFVENGSHLRTDEHRHDCWRSFVTTKPEVVGRCCDTCAQQVVVFVNGFDRIYKECEEE